MALYSLQDNENERVVIGKVMVTNNIIDTVSLLQQRLKNEGLRERTIYDYVKWYEHFINHCMKKGIQDLKYNESFSFKEKIVFNDSCNIYNGVKTIIFILS